MRCHARASLAVVLFGLPIRPPRSLDSFKRHRLGHGTGATLREGQYQGILIVSTVVLEGFQVTPRQFLGGCSVAHWQPPMGCLVACVGVPVGCGAKGVLIAYGMWVRGACRGPSSYRASHPAGKPGAPCGLPVAPLHPRSGTLCGHARGAPGLQVGHFLKAEGSFTFFKGVILTERGHLAAAEGLHLKGQQQPCCELSIAPRSDATLSTVGQSQYAQGFLEPRSRTGPLPLLMHHLYNTIDSSHSASTLEKT